MKPQEVKLQSPTPSPDFHKNLIASMPYILYRSHHTKYEPKVTSDLGDIR